MTIKVTLNDFLYNAGVLGLLRIFQHAKIPCEVEGQSLLFEESNLEDIGEHYFNFLIDRYGCETSYEKMISSEEFIKSCLAEQIEEKHLEDFNTLIENVKKWLTSNSYKNTYGFLTEVYFPFVEIAQSLKKITKKKSESIGDIKPLVQEEAGKLLDCISHLKHSQAKHYLVARSLSYQIIQGFWTNVSFLNSTASKKDLYGEYANYFTNAALTYIETKKDERKYEKNKLHCALCENTMGKLSETFDLTWLQKMGVDSARKSSHYWNHQKDLFICPICNLIYSCVPLGFTIAKGKGIFLNNNQSVKQLISANSISLRNGEKEITPDELEEMAYYRILDVMIQNAVGKKELEIDNIQIVKFDKYNESRPYTFNILSRERAKTMIDSKSSLNYLVGKFAKENKEYVGLYQEVIKRLYNGQSFYDLLYRLMKLFIEGEFKNGIAIKHILRISNNQFKGGIHFMTFEELEKVRNIGFYLKKQYYGQENKLGGISYRLLNALKVKNPNKFMETLIQAYSYKKVAIPIVFVQALSDQEKFQTIGYAFLLGLQGYDGQEKKEVKMVHA
ncbi:CRISPR-associated protein Cst1 [Psychrobacillus insolitus]|uniref:CRISPR-associated protein Cst1 n=1 Tax=Psychrobacillus insolitus TaxID=1461 RepID=A0A2W7MH91_9BACI|nr:type I-B CRISPR-associated protein Cas8b1/Cst1 [Psychrobacillus insolitus]PZX05806.1 CRISPR-associated protein Cst1 [Psychrobacillus insolitus]